MPDRIRPEPRRGKQLSATTAPQARTPPRRYYGWTVVATLALTETVSWGILFYAFSVFLTPMREDLGWSAATLTGAYSVALLVSGLAAPFVGRWLDRHGPRALMTAGSILGSLLVLAWAGAETRWGFYLIWAGIGLAMSATLYEPAFATVATWFERDRSRALLVVTLAAGFASTIFLPLTGGLVEWLGWRRALVVLAGLLAVLTIPPHAVLLRRRPEDLGLGLDGEPVSPRDRDVSPSADGLPEESGKSGKAGRSSAPGATDGPEAPEVRIAIPGVPVGEALRDPAFRWMTVAFCLEAFATVALGVHLIPYLTERGDGAAFAATAAGLIGAFQVAGRVLATALGGRVSAVVLTATVCAGQAAAVAVLLGWQERPGVLLAVVLLGAGRGVVTLMRAGLIAEFYGRANYGAISGMLAFFLTGARALAPVGAGVAYGVVGGYRPVLWGIGAASLLAAVAMVGVKRWRP